MHITTKMVKIDAHHSLQLNDLLNSFLPPKFIFISQTTQVLKDDLCHGRIRHPCILGMWESQHHSLDKKGHTLEKSQKVSQIYAHTECLPPPLPLLFFSPLSFFFLSFFPQLHYRESSCHLPCAMNKATGKVKYVIL